MICCTRVWLEPRLRHHNANRMKPAINVTMAVVRKQTKILFELIVVVTRVTNKDREVGSNAIAKFK